VSHYDLVVVGCGPVGAVAANLAGRAGLSTLVLDRSPVVFELPRAIHFDAQVMRILQQAGVADEVARDTRVWARSSFYGADGLLNRVHEWPRERPLGWAEHYLFYQPTFEAVLRAALARHPRVEVALGVEMVGMRQHDEHVELDLRDVRTGRPRQVSAAYVIGADGASSRIRAAIGVDLVDDGFDEPWLVVDLLADREIGPPDQSEMFCDPRRPATRVPGPGCHHRWEFMLLPGEDPEQMQRPETIEALLRPWVSLGEVDIVRAAVYRFHALVARSWRDRRIFLAGDAAHQTPPFLGQGMCHGIRDVQNLVWKLGAVLHGAPPEPLLDSYQAERAPHVRQIIDMAVAAGRDICLLDPVAAAARDRRVRQAAATGALPRTTFQGMPPLHGGLFSDTPGAGELFPQPMVTVGTGPQVRLDDVLPSATVVLTTATDAADLRAPVIEVAPPLAAASDPRVRSGAVLPDWFTARNATYAVVRPDRYVHGTAGTAAAAAALVREIAPAGQPIES
jgi:3-(3-hydroxy-phenyl)propionate hydroxylase